MPKYGQDILQDLEMDEELMEYVDKYKDKQLTTAEMDLKIQADKIIYIINRGLGKLNVVSHLPFLLESNAMLLKKHILKPSDVYFILDLLNRYGANCDTSFYSGQSLDEYSLILEGISSACKPQTNSKNRFDVMPDPQVSQMIDLIFYNRCLRQTVNTTDNKKVDKTVIGIMRVLTDMKMVAKKKIYVTGEEEEAMDRELRDAFKTNVLITASVNELKAHVEKQRKELGEQLGKKVQIFDMYNRKMDQLKEDFQAHIKKCLFESERVMMTKTVESEEKQATLWEDAKKITLQFETLEEDHLRREKQTRTKRFKVETQLQNWLTKFDQDIGERQAEYEALQLKYDTEKAEMDALQDAFDEQEEEYDVLMAEKNEEEERLTNEMAYIFSLNYAARKIQRWWRAYLERKRARRRARKAKGKGGKGGKGKGKDKAPPKGEPEVVQDPNAMLAGGTKKFGAGVFDELQDPNAFEKKDVPVDL